MASNAEKLLAFRESMRARNVDTVHDPALVKQALSLGLSAEEIAGLDPAVLKGAVDITNRALDSRPDVTDVVSQSVSGIEKETQDTLARSEQEKVDLPLVSSAPKFNAANVGFAGIDDLTELKEIEQAFPMSQQISSQEPESRAVDPEGLQSLDPKLAEEGLARTIEKGTSAEPVQTPVHPFRKDHQAAKDYLELAQNEGFDVANKAADRGDFDASIELPEMDVVGAVSPVEAPASTPVSKVGEVEAKKSNKIKDALGKLRKSNSDTSVSNKYDDLLKLLQSGDRSLSDRFGKRLPPNHPRVSGFYSARLEEFRRQASGSKPFSFAAGLRPFNLDAYTNSLNAHLGREDAREAALVARKDSDIKLIKELMTKSSKEQIDMINATANAARSEAALRNVDITEAKGKAAIIADRINRNYAEKDKSIANYHKMLQQHSLNLRSATSSRDSLVSGIANLSKERHPNFGLLNRLTEELNFENENLNTIARMVDLYTGLAAAEQGLSIPEVKSTLRERKASRLKRKNRSKKKINFSKGHKAK